MGDLQMLFDKTKNIGGGLRRIGSGQLKLLWMGVVGILLIVGGSFLPASPTRDQSRSPAVPAVKSAGESRGYEDILEAKLANLLSQIKGAGSVAVSITLETGAAQDFAKNIVRESKTIQEKDTSGGIRSTTETKETESILIGKENGIDRPVMLREHKPVIKGVLVIAEGAGDSQVKAQLTRAIEASLGIPSYKITVMPQRR